MRTILATAIALVAASAALAAAPETDSAVQPIDYTSLLMSDSAVLQTGHTKSCTTCPIDGCAEDCGGDVLCGTEACSGGACSGGACSGGGCCGSGRCGGCVTWAVGADWLFLGRSFPDSNHPIVECNCAHPHDARFTPNDFQPDWTSGARIRAYRQQACGPDYEFTYLEMDEWDEARYFSGDLTVLGTAIGTGTAYADFESTLRGVEFNSFTDCDCWTRFLLGVRWIQLDESASVYGAGTLGSQYQSIRTNNNLIGGQIGLNRLIWDNGGPWKIDLELLTGLYANIIDRDTRCGACVGSQDTTNLGSISEIELSGAYVINKCWAFNVGAHFLWLSGVASAPEQYYFDHYIHDDSTVFFAGGSLGLTRVW